MWLEKENGTRTGVSISGALPVVASLCRSSCLQYRDCRPLQDKSLWGSDTPKVEHCREPSGVEILLTPEQAAAKARKPRINNKRA